MNNHIVPVWRMNHINRVKVERNCCGFHLNFGYLKTYVGLIKIFELILNSICKFILSNFGLKYASAIGFSYDAFLSTVSATLITTLILVVTYILSENSSRLIRSSIFEILFNAVSCMNFVITCSWLMLTIHAFFYPQFLIIPFFIIYPLMLMVNILGFLLGIFYGVDCYLAYKYYKGYT